MQICQRKAQERAAWARQAAGDAAHQPAEPDEDQQQAERGADKTECEQWLPRGADRERDDGKQRNGDGDQGRPVDPRRLVDSRAVQPRRWDMLRGGERRHGKSDGDQQSISGADGKWQRIEREAGTDGQHVAGNRPDRERRQRADDQAGKNRHRGNRQDLQAIDAQHRRAVGAEDFQRRQPRTFARQIARNAIADADPGNDQRGEADQRQELPHALDKTPRSGRAVAAIGDVPACTREFGGERLADRFGIGAGGQADAIFAFEQAAGLDQLGRGQVGDTDDRDGAEREAFAQPVGLLGDDAVDQERFFAELHSFADLQVEPRGEILADPDAARGRRSAARAIFQPHRTIERIGSIDRLQFGQERVTRGRIGHRAHPHGGRCVAGFAKRSHFFGARFALRNAEFDIAAQDRLAADLKLGCDAARQTADRRQRRDPEKQADREQTQAADARR